MRGDECDGAGALIDLATLDADEPVLDHVQPADTLRTRALVELLDGFEHRDASAVDGCDCAVDETDDGLVGVARDRRVLRVGVHVLDRRVPYVLEEAGLDGAAPEVLV